MHRPERALACALAGGRLFVGRDPTADVLSARLAEVDVAWNALVGEVEDVLQVPPVHPRQRGAGLDALGFVARAPCDDAGRLAGFGPSRLRAVHAHALWRYTHRPTKVTQQSRAVKNRLSI